MGIISPSRRLGCQWCHLWADISIMAWSMSHPPLSVILDQRIICIPPASDIGRSGNQNTSQGSRRCLLLKKHRFVSNNIFLVGPQTFPQCLHWPSIVHINILRAQREHNRIWGWVPGDILSPFLDDKHIFLRCFYFPDIIILKVMRDVLIKS